VEPLGFYSYKLRNGALEFMIPARSIITFTISQKQ
jgi:hypothetical protein